MNLLQHFINLYLAILEILEKRRERKDQELFELITVRTIAETARQNSAKATFSVKATFLSEQN